MESIILFGFGFVLFCLLFSLGFSCLFFGLFVIFLDFLFLFCCWFVYVFVCSFVLFCCFSFGCIHIAPSFNCIFVLFYIADELLEKFTWLKELCLLWHIPIKSAGLFE